MASSTSFMNLVDRRKPKRSESVVDELALAKSAAWAWYERGSGLEGRPIREADGWMAKMEPRPSRYKLEALRKVQLQDHYHRNNSLLDRYEIERISDDLHYYIQSSRAKFHGGDAAGSAAADRKKKVTPTGFWSRRVPIVCGSSTDDVLNRSRSLQYRRHRQPEKGGVAVVELVSCRPRPWGTV